MRLRTGRSGRSGKLLFLAFVLVMSARAGVAAPVSFEYDGMCTDNCALTGLFQGGPVTVAITIDDALLPTGPGEVFIPNQEIQSFQLIWGNLEFDAADISIGSFIVVGTDPPMVSNGSGTLVVDTVLRAVSIGQNGGLFLVFTENVSSVAQGTWTFVPEPGPRPASIAALLAIAAVFASKQGRRAVGTGGSWTSKTGSPRNLGTD